MLTLVVQAGGQSRRMGTDKALLPFLGKPLIARVIERLSPLADEVLVTTNQPEGYEFLGVPLIADVIPGRGALGGLYTALDSAHHPLVAVVACDMPFASPRLLEYQIHLLEDPAVAAAIPRSEAGSEPFHSVYRRDACLPSILAAIQADQWRVDAWYTAASIRFLSPEELQLVDPGGLAFRNVNTPEELADAEQLATQIDSRSTP